MPYILTANKFEEREGGLYYIGALPIAKRFVRNHAGVTERPVGELFEVLIGYDFGEVDWEDCAEWGRGPDAETAWRYALGANLGPIDEEFHEFDLEED